jgi:hypothetical protein
MIVLFSAFKSTSPVFVYIFLTLQYEVMSELTHSISANNYVYDMIS